MEKERTDTQNTHNNNTHDDTHDTSENKSLRRSAEEKLKKKDLHIPGQLEEQTPGEMRRLLYELQVHQIELEMQNEELRRVQLELESSHARYFDLYEMAPVGYVTLDEHGLIQRANFTASRLLEVEKNKLLREPLTRFIFREDQDTYYRFRWELFKTRRQETCELRMLKNGGASWFWALLEMTLGAEDEKGLPVCRAVIMDVTEQKRAEEVLQKAHDELAQRTAELAQANEKYRLLVENTPDLIYSLDQELRFTYVNQSLCRIIGAEAGELIGKTYRDLGFSGGLAHKFEGMFKTVLTGKTVELETSSPITDDGTARSYWTLLMPVFDERDQATGITGISRDLTERKKMEEEIIKADKLESIGILAGGIAHDFNNYLAVLLGNISLVKMFKDDTLKVLEKLDNMERATLRAKDLSNQLLTFAKGGAPVKETLAVGSFLVNQIKTNLTGSKVRPEFFMAEDLDAVEADKGQLGQALNNITLNAVEAMPQGGVLKIWAEKVNLEAEGWNSILDLKEGLYVKIMIKDEGTGIPEKHMSKIFTPFFSTKDKARGLGLPTAYSIIKKHGGHLSLDSTFNVGTSVIIYLPALAQKTAVLGDRRLQGSGDILLMDDEEDLLTVTGESLSILGYQVTLARDGKEALEHYGSRRAKGEPFDLVILDLTIASGMGGRETLEELMKIDPKVKAIVASGYSNDPVMSNYEDYGFKGAVKKPFTIETLSRAVSEVM